MPPHCNEVTSDVVACFDHVYSRKLSLGIGKMPLLKSLLLLYMLTFAL